mmetsp:Transcript_62384/g.167023  ORF Transcript_62384/g.167023 Transcript_62384/m.167023 type:complete len:103 (-) Transcript_62384:984-1292(-)
MLQFHSVGTRIAAAKEIDSTRQIPLQCCDAITVMTVLMTIPMVVSVMTALMELFSVAAATKNRFIRFQPSDSQQREILLALIPIQFQEEISFGIIAVRTKWN